MSSRNDDNPHDAAAGAPGASGPGQPGYEGAATIGEDGAVPTSLSYIDPEDVDAVGEDEIPDHVKDAWAMADAKDAQAGRPTP